MDKRPYQLTWRMKEKNEFNFYLTMQRQRLQNGGHIYTMK